MNKLFSNKFKFLIVTTCLVMAFIGFMIKLPPIFRGHDHEMHSFFFFNAAFFFNALFSIKKLDKHLLIFGMLFLFSALIEFIQEYSNRFFIKKIHGRFDPIDLEYNLYGLLLFSLIWTVYIFVRKIFKK